MRAVHFLILARYSSEVKKIVPFLKYICGKLTFGEDFVFAPFVANKNNLPSGLINTIRLLSWFHSVLDIQLRFLSTE